ncbi:MAG: CRISPR-associated protein Cas4 [Deltaproteobacteria bacterium]|nr:CRISPR-associated protein Cas4 [Deltaproteobacteria bacterium]
MYDEDDLIPISALQHFLFCERQCALIHIEQLWGENRRTAEGRIMHEKVHGEDTETRGSFRTERGVSLRSLRLGLIGKADVVEFHKTGDRRWLPFPVEHKRGRPKIEDWDRVQLCAQALCLEEMLSVQIQRGAIFYGTPRRREEVDFNQELRAKTKDTANAVRRLLAEGVTPKPGYRKRCVNCSMAGFCLPRVIESKKSVSKYLQKETAGE